MMVLPNTSHFPLFLFFWFDLIWYLFLWNVRNKCIQRLWWLKQSKGSNILTSGPSVETFLFNELKAYNMVLWFWNKMNLFYPKKVFKICWKKLQNQKMLENFLLLEKCWESILLYVRRWHLVVRNSISSISQTGGNWSQSQLDAWWQIKTCLFGLQTRTSLKPFSFNRQW